MSERCTQCAVADQLQCVLDLGHEGDCMFAYWPYNAAAPPPANDAKGEDWWIAACLHLIDCPLEDCDKCKMIEKEVHRGE